ncbi:MAG: hypothetical protein FJX75_21535 [Armatimonadetes bacterium]|nr:hypothetical protein [Armatimonadota bacterium]
MHRELRKLTVDDLTLSEDVPPMPIEAQGFERSDLGNAERLVAHHGADLPYCWPWQSWPVWDGKRWQKGATGEVDRRAKLVVRAIIREAYYETNPERRAALSKWAASSKSDLRVKAMIRRAQSEVPVTYDLEARSELWGAFLNRATRDDLDLQRFLQKVAGLCLTGITRDAVVVFVYGPTASGKTSFVEALKSILRDHAKTITFETFAALKYAQPNAATPEIAGLAGCRLVTAVETWRSVKLSADLLK